MDTSKRVKFIDFKESHPKNILFISVTKEKLKLSKLIDSNDVHPEKALLISVINEELKWEKSIDLIFPILISQL